MSSLTGTESQYSTNTIEMICNHLLVFIIVLESCMAAALPLTEGLEDFPEMEPVYHICYCHGKETWTSE